MKSIRIHWTGGTGHPSAYEKTCYHSLTDDRGQWHDGDKPPEANKSPLGSGYVRHTGGGNTDAIGHAICAMGGHEVREKPLRMGSYPVKMLQIDAAAKDIAERYCTVYGIPPIPGRIETHAEFYQRTGKGKYKWDITCIEGDKEVRSAREVGDMIRAKIAAHLEDAPAPSRTPPPWLTAILNLFKGVTK